MRYVPRLTFTDRKSFRRCEDGQHWHRRIEISFRHDTLPNGNFQKSWIMIMSVEYVGQVVDYAGVIWATHHIIPSIKTLFRRLFGKR